MPRITRTLIWWFYADLKAWARAPCPKRARALRARFDRIFTRRTGAAMRDRLRARLHRHKAALLRVLERPEIPLHNGSENDSRACVTKRKISGGPRPGGHHRRPRRRAPALAPVADRGSAQILELPQDESCHR
ncbi:hypothetical protein [uncultured Methylobacterium sp.]|uniref:hypothetical protein n=1 Tax=uncultured Methylobacterium sp. TaxID=157278 RepID=UPI0035CB9D78